MADKDVTTLLVDSTALSVHRHGAGALKKGGGKKANRRMKQLDSEAVD